MISLLAQAAETSGTMDISAVGTLIGAVVMALVGAGGHKLLTHKTTIADQPIKTQREKEPASKEDISRIESMIIRNNEQRTKEISDLHDKVNENREDTAELKGQFKLVLKKLYPHGC